MNRKLQNYTQYDSISEDKFNMGEVGVHIWKIAEQGFKLTLESPPHNSSWSAHSNPWPIFELIRERELGNRFFVPDTTVFSGLIAETFEERSLLSFDGEISLYTANNREGAFLAPDEGFVMCTGGCPVVIAIADTGEMCVTHAGRDSLVPRDLIMGLRGRQYESVIEAMAAAFKKRQIPLKKVRLHAYFSVSPEEFTHPFEHETYGLFNRNMCVYIKKRWGVECPDGQLDLGELIRAQGVHLGFGSSKNAARIPFETDPEFDPAFGCENLPEFGDTPFRSGFGKREFPTTRNGGNKRSLLIATRKSTR